MMKIQTSLFKQITPAEQSLLTNIANQCPITGGQAVYIARSLYEAIEPTIYNDDAICQAVGISQKTTALELDTEKHFTIMPNPAISTITIQHNFIDYTQAQIILYSATGQTVKQVTLPTYTQQLQVDIHQLTTGIYWCKLVIDNQTVATQKVVIMR